MSGPIFSGPDARPLRRMYSWLFALVVTILSGVLWAWIFSGQQWEAPEPPRVQGEALELIGNGLARHRPEALALPVREFQNTWSSLGYVLMGMAIALRATSFAGRLVGLALVGLGWGCGIYHASIMPAWRLFDIIGMYWVVYALIVYGAVGILRQRPLHGWGGNLLGFSVAIAAIATSVHRNDWRPFGVKFFDSTYVAVWGFFLVGLLVAIAMLQAKLAIRGKVVLWGIGSLLGIGIAATCQVGDRVGGFLFAPRAIIHAHAVWHLLTAVAVGMAYEVFRIRWHDASLFARSD